MSFFVSSDKIKVGQQSVAIPSENGLDYNPGGRIDLYIPPTSKFVDLSQSKLHMEVDLSIPTDRDSVMRLQLDAETGLHSLISSIRIYTGRKTALLEEIQGYDVLSALKFDYNSNESLSKKRALTEGTTVYDPACRATTGTTKTKQGNCFSNPYFSSVDNPTATLNVSFETAGAAVPNTFTTVKGILSLNTGLFQNDAVFPAVLTDGIFIEIMLKEAKQVFRSLDTCNYFRRTKLNPIFHSTNGSDQPGAAAGNGSLINGATTNVIFVTRANNQTSQSTFPFVVGQRVALALENSVITGAASFTTSEKIITIENVSGTAVGESKTKITLAGNITNNTGKPMGTGSGGFFASASLAFLVDMTTDASIVAQYDPTFRVKNVEMIVEQIEVPDGYEQTMLGMMREGGTINYDYPSFTNYRYSQIKDDLVVNMRLPLIESRATAILCVPTDATPYTNAQHLNCSNTYLENNESNDIRNRSSRSGIVGIIDELQNYQLIYDGRINPSRKVDVSKISSRTSISQQWVIEAEKALAMSGIEPLSFLKFQSNWFLGRALSLGRNAVYDARGKDFNVQLEYTKSGSPPSKNHLWQNFCAHVRRLEIKNGSLQVMI